YAWEQGQVRFGVTDLPDDFQTRQYGAAVEMLRRIQRWVTRGADRVMTPSEYLKGIARQWGIASEKITVIPNAVSDLPPFSNPNVQTLASRAPTITTAGRFLPWKGIRELIAALPSIRQQAPNATL